MTRSSQCAMRPVLLALVALIAICVSIIAAMAWGSTNIAWSDVVNVLSHHLIGAELDSEKSTDTIVWQLRAPRGILAAIVGAGLAVSGVAMQALVRNPLADPYLLGISAGAGVGATAVILFGVFSGTAVSALTLGALIGALGATIAVAAVARAAGGLTPLRLVLSGVVLSAAFSALSSFMVFAGPDPRAAQSVMFWMLGSVAGATWSKLWLPCVAVAVIGAILWFRSRYLDALSTGDSTAAAVGLDVTRFRREIFILQAILVGALVAVSGGIGFVGLVVPHLARMLVGASHRVLIPFAALGGALFLVWVDIVARLVGGSQEMPLGVVTGLIGAPVFLYLMVRGTYRYGGSQ